MARVKKVIAKVSDRQIIINELIGLALIAISLIMFISIFVISQNNITNNSYPGAIGAALVRFSKMLMGEGKFFLPMGLLYLGYRHIKDNAGIKYDLRTSGAVLIISSLLMIMHINQQFLGIMDNLIAAKDGVGGGIIGSVLIIIFRSFFGLWGAWIFSGVFFIAGIMMFTGFSLKHILSLIKNRTTKAWYDNKDTLLDMLFVEEEVSSTSQDNIEIENPAHQTKIIPDERKEKFVLIDMSDHNQSQRSHLDTINTIDEGQPVKSKNNKNEHDTVNNTKSSEEDINQNASILEIDTEKQQIQIAFRLPPLTLLDANATKSKVSEAEISEKVIILENTLRSFGISAKVTQVNRGPAVTRFELEIPLGVKVSKITGLADNIALSLACADVRIATIPGKSAIGIEVPNKDISAVGLRTVLESDNYVKATSKLTCALGKDITGQTIIADMGKMPHLLVAGSTGSGKSVCMNTLICSILFKATPKEVRFLMIDPKMVELTAYNGIPHLIVPVVTDPRKAAAVLKWVVSEMENRYEQFAMKSVKDITRYNNHMETSGNEIQKMPYIMVMIDELADLMMVAAQDVEESICRLAQMARAAGIHLVVATQRPSVDVITGLIKANIPSRIAFSVMSQMDSRTILDMSGAEKLLGRGDMLYYPVGNPKPVRVQGAFVSDKEVDKIVSYLKISGVPEYNEKVLEIEPLNAKANENENTDVDALFYDAGRLLIESGQASISMLQRRFRVGYARAARLVDMLEQKGVIGGFEGSKPRRILMDIDQFDSLFLEKNAES